MATTKEALFIRKWKDKVKMSIYRTYGVNAIADKKIEEYLNQVIADKMHNPRIRVVNNYLNKLVNTDLLQLYDLVDEQKYIIGGDGVLYVPHSLKDNILSGFIIMNMDQRDKLKAERKKYDEDTYEWLTADIGQLNVKIVINTLYGVTGYARFILSNRFIAQSVTNMGKQIICTAVCAFENFIADNVGIATFSELYEYMNNICDEYAKHYRDKLDMSGFSFENDPIITVKNRLKKKCVFRMTIEQESLLEEFLAQRELGELILLYYKNNFLEFNKVSIIRDKIEWLINEIDQMMVPEIDKLRPDIQEVIKDLIGFYEVFVIYNYPSYDRVRKSMYTDKRAVLYVDTDSNFLSCAGFVNQCTNEIMHDHFNKPKTDAIFIMVNLLAYICHKVVNDALYVLSKSMNCEEGYDKYLYMKNEFYMSRIVFTDKKKRYFSNQIIQEGKILNKGIGKPDIKGFDFKKSTTKPFVRDFLTEICSEDILRAEHIDLIGIYKKTRILVEDIEKSVRSGESKYFKQSNVKLLEQYKKPYSQQQTTSVLLWNILVPEYNIDLPGDVDIVPIKELGAKKKKDKNTGQTILDFASNKNVQLMKEKYPEAYARFESGILNSGNEGLLNMSMKYIAKPKNADIPLPEWWFDFVDSDKIVNDTMALFIPIMETLGFKSQKITAKSTMVSNMIDL